MLTFDFEPVCICIEVLGFYGDTIKKSSVQFAIHDTADVFLNAACVLRREQYSIFEFQRQCVCVCVCATRQCVAIGI